MIGTILTIIFGIVGVASLVYAILARQYRYKLEFYINDFVQIISSEANKYGTIKLLHKDKEIRNVYYLKCFFVCTGEDIVLPDDARQGIQINLPSAHKWLEIHSQESTMGLDVALNIDNAMLNKLHISSPLIKRNEVYSFEAYVGGDTDTYISTEDIIIKHRLKDLGKINIQQINLKNIHGAKQKLITKGITYLIVLLYMGLLLVNTLFARPIRFIEKNNPEKIHTVMLVKDDTIAVSNRHSALFPWDRKEYAISRFNEEFEVESTLPKHYKDGNQTIIIAFFVIVIAYAVLWIMDTVELLRKKRLYRALNLAVKEK